MPQAELFPFYLSDTASVFPDHIMSSSQMLSPGLLSTRIRITEGGECHWPKCYTEWSAENQAEWLHQLPSALPGCSASLSGIVLLFDSLCGSGGLVAGQSAEVCHLKLRKKHVCLKWHVSPCDLIQSVINGRATFSTLEAWGGCKHYQNMFSVVQMS